MDIFSLLIMQILPGCSSESDNIATIYIQGHLELPSTYSEVNLFSTLGRLSTLHF